MALLSYSLATLAELKSYLPIQSTGKDPELERALGLSTEDIEAATGRRLIYRAPTATSESVIVNAQAFIAGGIAVANQPNSGGRTLVVTFSIAGNGTVTVTGTVGGVAGQTEAFDAVDGKLQYGVKFFTAISAVTGANPPSSSPGTVNIALSQGYIEFYSPMGSEITPIEWPVRYVAEVNEDMNRTFAAATALTAGFSYEIRQPSSPLRAIARIYSGFDYAFYCGFRVVKGRLSAGFKGPSEVPLNIKGVCLELAAWYHKHSEGGQYGLSSQSDAMGNRSFSGPPMLTDGMLSRLRGEVRPEFDQVAERDFDLRAA